MATIASLVVELSANVAKFHSGMDGIRKELRSVQWALNAIAFNQLTELGKKAFQVGKQVYDLSRNVANAANEIQRSAQIIGLSTDAFQQFQFAANLSDVEMVSFSTGLKILSRNMEDTTQGTGEAANYFKGLGISVKDTAGNLKPLDQMLKEVADRFASWEDGSRKMAIALALFGRSGQDMIPILNKGAIGIEELMNKARELGQVMDPELVKKASAAEEQFKIFEGSIKNLKNTIVAALMPTTEWGEAIGKLTVKITDFYKEIAKSPQAQGIMGLILGTIAGAPMLGMQYLTERLHKYLRLKEEMEKLVPDMGVETIEGVKEQPPQITKPEKAQEALKVEEQLLAGAMKYYELQKKLADMQGEHDQEIESNRILEGLYESQLRIKKAEIDALKDVDSETKSELKDVETMLYTVQKLTREWERFGAIEKKQVEQLAESWAMFADNRKKEEEEAWKVIEETNNKEAELLSRQTELMAQINVDLADMTGDYNLFISAQKNLLEIEADRIISENELTGIYADQVRELYKQKSIKLDTEMEQRRVEILAQTKSMIGAMSGDYDLMITGQKMMLQLEMERLIVENKLTGVYKEQVEHLYKMKQIELDAKRTMNVGQLIDIGANKALIQANEDLSYQYQNILPNAIDLTTSALWEMNGSFENFFDTMERGFMRMIQDISMTIIKMEILKALGYGQGGGGAGLVGGLFSGLLGILGLGGGATAAIAGAGIALGPGGEMPMQHGGIVTRPTRALIGENGPEAVVPLNRGLPMQPIVINVYTPDGNSFRQSKGQIAREYAVALARSRRDA